MKTVTFTPESFKKFKQAYYRAVADGATSFTFEGHEYLVDYAQFVIQYLSSKVQ